MAANSIKSEARLNGHYLRPPRLKSRHNPPVAIPLLMGTPDDPGERDFGHSASIKYVTYRIHTVGGMMVSIDVARAC